MGRSGGAKEVIRKLLRGGLQRVADQVKKNDLFGQLGERPMQESIAVRQQREAATARAKLANLDAIENELLSYRVINHWATWCEPCVEEIPALKRLGEEIGVDKILGISWDLFQGGRPDEVCKHVDSVALVHEIEYLSLIVTSPPEAFFAHFDIEEQTVPQTWVFTEEFDLIYLHKGVLKDDDVDKIIKLLSQPN